MPNLFATKTAKLAALRERVMISLLQRLFTTAGYPSAAAAEPNPHLSRMPSIVYGTAWKKERTAELVIAAVRAGFRAIDTACQPKHYHDAGDLLFCMVKFFCFPLFSIQRLITVPR